MTWILSFLGLNYPFLIAAGLFLLYAVWKKDLGLIVGSAILLVAVFYIGSLRASVDTLREENAKLKTKTAEISAQVHSQNQAIEAWQAAAVKNAALRRSAEDRAASLARSAQNQPIPIPPVPQASCHERDQWLRDQLNQSLWPAR